MRGDNCFVLTGPLLAEFEERLTLTLILRLHSRPSYSYVYKQDGCSFFGVGDENENGGDDDERGWWW